MHDDSSHTEHAAGESSVFLTAGATVAAAADTADTRARGGFTHDGTATAAASGDSADAYKVHESSLLEADNENQSRELESSDSAGAYSSSNKQQQREASTSSSTFSDGTTLQGLSAKSMQLSLSRESAQTTRSTDTHSTAQTSSTSTTASSSDMSRGSSTGTAARTVRSSDYPLTAESTPESIYDAEFLNDAAAPKSSSSPLALEPQRDDHADQRHLRHVDSSATMTPDIGISRTSTPPPRQPTSIFTTSDDAPSSQSVTTPNATAIAASAASAAAAAAAAAASASSGTALSPSSPTSPPPRGEKSPRRRSAYFPSSANTTTTTTATTTRAGHGAGLSEGRPVSTASLAALYEAGKMASDALAGAGADSTRAAYDRDEQQQHDQHGTSAQSATTTTTTSTTRVKPAPLVLLPSVEHTLSSGSTASGGRTGDSSSFYLGGEGSRSSLAVTPPANGCVSALLVAHSPAHR